MSFSPFVFQHLLEMLNVIASARQERASQGLTEGRVVILYEDFSLKIEPQRGNVYPVIVLRSPAGEGRGSFRLPFNPDDIGDMLFDLARTVRGSGRAPLRDAAPGATRTLPQQIGDQLFGALFSGSVRSLFDRSLGMIHGRERGLRIKLHIDPEDASLAKLAGLPWEFMYRKETRDFLGLSRSTPIVRYLDVQRPCVPLPLELPLRILVVISSPTNYRQLDLDEERQRIEASWAKQAGVQVEFLQPATRTALRDRLAEVEQPYHVVHYMGHGGFSQHSGRGVLILEEEDGLGDPVDGSTLGILLRDMPSLRLVFLNACETARVTKQEGLDPFAGVAAALVMAGVPAVVAMQFPITDQAAVTFAQRFYPLLARGQPVDMAVAEGRRAVRLAESETMEWATPVLFMRAPEGVLFETKEPQPAARPLPKLPDIDEELEQRLEQLYTAGLSAFWLGEWEKATPYFQAIVDVRPDYEDAAAKLVASQRQAKLKDLYERAQAARADEEWQAALTALEELVSHTPDYKDAAALLEATKRQKQLADLYGEAQRLSQAEKWQAVVNVFARIAALDPHYPDPDALLPTAEAAFAEQQRQEELKGLHGRALRAMNAGQWTAARALLTQLQEMEPGYGDAERLLAKVEEEISRAEAERQRQEQIAVLYKEAQELAVAGEWQQILATVQEIQKLDPDYADLEGLAAQAQAEVQRQERLEQLYTEAEAAEKVEDWGGAIAALESLLDEDADFRNAAVLLARAREQQRLDELYLEAQQHYEAGRWQDVVDTFAQITTIEPNYPDPDRLLDSARQEMAIQKRQAELDALYHHATQAMEAGQWEQARQLLDQIQEQEPGFRQTEQLLAQAEDEIKGAEAEQRRQEQAATLYEQAQGLVRAKQWRGALGKMEALETLAPDFGDPEGIAGTAQEELAHEEEEARRQHELATLYAEAVHLLKAEHYQEALEKWREVQALDPRYPDRRRVQATARKKLDSLARPAARRRLPTWTIPAIGGLVLIALIVAGVLLGDRPGGGAPEAPAASQPTATAKPDTETPTRTARPTMATATTGFPAFVSDVLPDAELVYHDDFDQLRSWEWGYEGVYVEASDGLAVIVGKPSHSWLESKRSLSEGEGVLVLFKYDAGSGCWFSLYSGVWRTSSWRVWHIGCDLYPWFDQGWAGGGSEGPLVGDLKSNPNTWYYVLLAVGEDGEIVAQVWERDDPDQKARYRRAFGEDWAGQTWQFSIAVSEGMAYVDSFTQISFGEILGTWTSGKAPEAPGTYLDRALAGEFEGTAVRVLGEWAGVEAAKFRASVADFEDETGIDIQYLSSADLDAEIANGVFDMVGFPNNPGMLATYARQGQVVDVSTFLPQSSFDNYDQSWWDMATMEGSDGQDITAGVWHHFSPKSLVWYPKDDFEAAGYEIPNTWEEMLALSDQIVADGGTPWCIGIESDWATGWPATDWIEDILLRTTSLENYDRWVAGELPFDSPEVRHAAEVMSDIWFNDDYVYGGRDYIVNTFFGEAFNPMFEDPPKCWLHRQANFITSFFPPGVEAGRDYDFFYLPPIDPTYGKPYLITADIMAMFNDRDEVRAVMEYLTKGESTKGWLAAGGALAPHKDARLGWYGDRVERRIAEVSFGATSFRFDGSDLMPGQVGAGSFWKGMTDWVSGAADIDTVVKEIDATWPR